MAIALAAMAWTPGARLIAGRLSVRPFAVANLAKIWASRTARCGPSIAGTASAFCAPTLLSGRCESEQAESEVRDESVFAGALEVEVAELFNSAQPLVEGRAVDDHVLCCRLGVAGAIEEFLGGPGEFDVSVQHVDAWVDHVVVGVGRRNRDQGAVGADVVPSCDRAEPRDAACDAECSSCFGVGGAGCGCGA